MYVHVHVCASEEERRVCIYIYIYMYIYIYICMYVYIYIYEYNNMGKDIRTGGPANSRFWCLKAEGSSVVGLKPAGGAIQTRKVLLSSGIVE